MSPSASAEPVLPNPGPAVRWLGPVAFAPTFEAMRAFTEARGPDTPNELWLCEHPPTFTLGVAAKPEHLLNVGDIPVLPTNRGGQVTYHGPGQVVAYVLVDLRREGIYVKEFVHRLERSVLNVLQGLGVTGHRVRGEPGIYVRQADPFGHARLPTSPAGAWPFEGLAKIAALGVKVSRHCSYHGLALNVSMDLSPFARINPCGHAGLATTDLASLGVPVAPQAVAQALAASLSQQFGP